MPPDHPLRSSYSAVVLVVLLCCWLASGDDKHALLEFKSALTRDPLGLTSSWDPKDPDPCSWHGVTCDSLSRRVTALQLSSRADDTACSLLSLPPSSTTAANGNFSLLFPCLGVNLDALPKLQGKLSPKLAQLSQLTTLSLSFNDLSGELPPEIGQLQSLEVLDLGFNVFHGSIPFALQNSSSLRVINLSGNQLNGTIPAFFHQLRAVRVVALSFNLLSGSIPVEIGDNCGSLEHLLLNGNSLTGSIPLNLGSCRELRSLLLSSNLLQDDVPSTLGNLTNLEVLDLSRNFLSGNIPPELGNCQQLKLLVLKNTYGLLWSRGPASSNIDEEERGEGEFNYFDENLPGSILKLPNLRVLWAPNLNLEGSFPQTLGPSCNLKMLNLAGNYFSGEVPVSLGNCYGLTFLDLSSNNFTGPLPSELSVPCMVFFNVSHNTLSGAIPRFSSSRCGNVSTDVLISLGNALGFYSSFFYANAVRGIPSFSFPSSDLAVLHDLSNNLFTGLVPALFIASESFPRKTYYGFWLAGNNLGGNITTFSFDPCSNLNGLVFDVANNKVVGELPSAIGTNCKCLRFLSMAVNSLIGSVPQSFAYLDSLVYLNLSSNRLQDTIPSYFGQMKTLRVLSVSSNNFSGSIPLELGQLSALEVLDLSSNSLSGEMPPDLSRLEHLGVLRLDRNNLSGKIPSGFSDTTSLLVLDVAFNNLSGPLPLNSNLVKCDNFRGNPNLQPCHGDTSTPEWEQANTPSGSNPPRTRLNPIEVSSVTSASVIVAVLITLAIVFFCLRKFSFCSTSGHGSGVKEVITFNDIGVQLTYENVVKATGGFNIQYCIGSGGFGATYKAEIVPGVMVAVKRLSVGRFQGFEQLSAEIRTLGRVQHPNLVKLIGCHVSESEMFLIYNYLPGGNLEKFIQERSRRAVEWSMLHKIALDIARALAYLHDECVPRVLHRDIKPSNILLDNKFNAYLSDFGLARLLGTSETHATTDVAGTFGYVAPEYAMTCRVSDKADVYSYGVVLLELMSDKKALDPSFSSFGNGFNIVGWACMLLRQGRASEFFMAGLWDSGAHDDLIEILHLGIMCTGETFSSRPSMRQVAQRLKRIQPSIILT
ncbi:unnamed protein product [Linum tenue]|uniref:non-specific serine/threonine protein kinase n=2 Tax=Linum tenue TaxID=586396 RepID=A0AAV0KTB6_9ROSI|nr:unnamed protein product [Linum tenue]